MGLQWARSDSQWVEVARCGSQWGRSGLPVGRGGSQWVEVARSELAVGQQWARSGLAVGSK